jgi:hypothetical protein
MWGVLLWSFLDPKPHSKPFCKIRGAALNCSFRSQAFQKLRRSGVPNNHRLLINTAISSRTISWMESCNQKIWAQFPLLTISWTSLTNASKWIRYQSLASQLWAPAGLGHKEPLVWGLHGPPSSLRPLLPLKEGPVGFSSWESQNGHCWEK